MEEKQPKGIKFSTVLIIIAIVIVLAIGGLIYLNSISQNDDEDLLETQSTTDIETEEIEENEIEEDNEKTTNTLANESEDAESAERAEEDEETITTGKYVIQEMEISPDSDETYGIENIDIQKNNKFSINLPLGTSYQGTYTVQGEKIVCIASKQGENEGGEETAENIAEIEFIFEIVDENSLEYIGSNSEESYFELTEGKTYTLENKD